MRTEFDALHAEALLDEAVDFVHFSECWLGPAVLLDDPFDLLAERLDGLRVRCEVKQGVCEHLRCGICYVRPRSGHCKDANAHERTSRSHAESAEHPSHFFGTHAHLYSCKIEDEETPRQALYAQLGLLTLSLVLVHQPRQEVVLSTIATGSPVRKEINEPACHANPSQTGRRISVVLR